MSGSWMLNGDDDNADYVCLTLEYINYYYYILIIIIVNCFSCSCLLVGINFGE